MSKTKGFQYIDISCSRPSYRRHQRRLFIFFFFLPSFSALSASVFTETSHLSIAGRRRSSVDTRGRDVRPSNRQRTISHNTSDVVNLFSSYVVLCRRTRRINGFASAVRFGRTEIGVHIIMLRRPGFQSRTTIGRRPTMFPPAQTAVLAFTSDDFFPSAVVAHCNHEGRKNNIPPYPRPPTIIIIVEITLRRNDPGAVCANARVCVFNLYYYFCF